MENFNPDHNELDPGSFYDEFHAVGAHRREQSEKLKGCIVATEVQQESIREDWPYRVTADFNYDVWAENGFLLTEKGLPSKLLIHQYRFVRTPESIEFFGNGQPDADWRNYEALNDPPFLIDDESKEPMVWYRGDMSKGKYKLDEVNREIIIRGGEEARFKVKSQVGVFFTNDLQTAAGYGESSGKYTGGLGRLDVASLQERHKNSYPDLISTLENQIKIDGKKFFTRSLKYPITQEYLVDMYNEYKARVDQNLKISHQESGSTKDFTGRSKSEIDNYKAVYGGFSFEEYSDYSNLHKRLNLKNTYGYPEDFLDYLVSEEDVYHRMQAFLRSFVVHQLIYLCHGAEYEYRNLPRNISELNEEEKLDRKVKSQIDTRFSREVFRKLRAFFEEPISLQEVFISTPVSQVYKMEARNSELPGGSVSVVEGREIYTGPYGIMQLFRSGINMILVPNAVGAGKAHEVILNDLTQVRVCSQRRIEVK